jgi:serine/threonine protein kinase
MKPVRRYDDEPLSAHVPPEVCSPFGYFGKFAHEVTVEDAKTIVLTDLGRVSQPGLQSIPGKKCFIALSECAPEALFRPNDTISYAFDIWSLACTIWDILGISTLFRFGYENPDVLIADQICALGIDTFPLSWREEWESEQSENDIPPENELPPPRQWRPRGTYKILPLEPRFEDDVQGLRRRFDVSTFEEDEKEAILTLMRGMLAFEPKDRSSIQGVLESEWMVKWALPALNDDAVIVASTNS